MLQVIIAYILKHCYRRNPILDSATEKIAFGKTNGTRAITELGWSDANEKLEELAKQRDVSMDLKRLHALPTSEPLYQVQDCVPSIRVNALYKNGTRKAYKGVVPVICPMSPGDVLPSYSFNLVPRKRRQRSDKYVSDVPYLQAIRGHLTISTFEKFAQQSSLII